ncbi:hypothetical protein F4811DRAFT_198002 [Daldinia bambusicola]|nr:hypothetical protein F4811DRAFT_198002 [Daldinia bambusicola]
MKYKDSPRYTQLPDSSHRKQLQSWVEIYHPGYTPPAPLIVLRAFDDGQLLYSMVYIVCCIILGNVWADDEGLDPLTQVGPFLSSSPEPEEARFIPQDSMVPAGVYYLHYPGYKKSKLYPIVPHFNHWKFPESLPKSWENLRPIVPVTSDSISAPSSETDAGGEFADDAIPRVPSAYDSRQRPCPLTGQVSVLEDSYILPQTTKTFIKHNNMRKYLASDKSAPTYLSPDNYISFRKDVQTLWDSNAFVFVPKPDKKDRSCLVCHVLNPPGKSVDSDMEIHSLYHNIPIQVHHPIEFLFARFSWSLFTSRTIVLFTDDDGESEYSVLLRDVEKDKMVEEILPLRSLPRLLTKAMGAPTQGVAGEKRDASHLDADPPEEPIDGDLVFSVRAGKFEPYDDPREPGDRGCSNWSRLSFHSDSQSEYDSDLVRHSEGASGSETGESEDDNHSSQGE